jgi:hypothetical protein
MLVQASMLVEIDACDSQHPPEAEARFFIASGDSPEDIPLGECFDVAVAVRPHDPAIRPEITVIVVDKIVAVICTCVDNSRSSRRCCSSSGRPTSRNS